MRPEGIEARRLRRRRDAVRGVVFFALLQLACAACFGSLCFIPELPGWCVAMFAVLAVLPLALLIPAVWVLKQRFAEIEGGEFDDAGQY